MSDNDSREDLIEKIKKMSEEELTSYYRIAKTVNTVINIFGVSLYLMIMFFTSMFVAFGCAILIAWAAVSGSQALMLKKLIRQELVKFERR